MIFRYLVLVCLLYSENVIPSSKFEVMSECEMLSLAEPLLSEQTEIAKMWGEKHYLAGEIFSFDVNFIIDNGVFYSDSDIEYCRYDLVHVAKYRSDAYSSLFEISLSKNTAIIIDDFPKFCSGGLSNEDYFIASELLKNKTIARVSKVFRNKGHNNFVFESRGEYVELFDKETLQITSMDITDDGVLVFFVETDSGLTHNVLINFSSMTIKHLGVVL